MSPEERRAYSRGYNAGRTNRWPEDVPAPPVPVVAELLCAMKAMRDRADTFRASIDPADEWVAMLEPIIDQADDAMRKVAAWLENQVREGRGT